MTQQQSSAARAARLRSFAALLAAALCMAEPAAAYVDPGTGSMMLQMLGAAVAGALFYFRELRLKLVAMLASWRRGRSGDGDGA